MAHIPKVHTEVFAFGPQYDKFSAAVARFETPGKANMYKPAAMNVAGDTIHVSPDPTLYGLKEAMQIAEMTVKEAAK